MGKANLGKDVKRQIGRCNAERRKIREKLYRMGYPMMSLEKAERLARELTRRH